MIVEKNSFRMKTVNHYKKKNKQASKQTKPSKQKEKEIKPTGSFDLSIKTILPIPSAIVTRAA
jgi:hypothetical protein